MNLKNIFSLRTVRKKIIITSKLAGAVLVASYLFSVHVSDNPEVSLLVWLAFVIPLILTIDFLLGRFISDPVSRLNEAAGRLAALDFSAPCRLTSDDEFGELSGSLGRMSEKLQDTLSRLEHANSQLEDTNLRLEHANSQLESMNTRLEAANGRLAADVAEKQRLLAERRDLADSLSHEMKTPVGVIRAYAEGIQDESDEAARQRYADIIISETQRINGLVTALLDLSALESGASPLVIEQFDFVEFVETAAGRLLPDLPDADFRFGYELPEQKIYVKTDRKRMEQVLDNLILNARKNVCPGGKLNLSLTMHGDSLHFSIFNQGKNIPEEILPEIWKKFYRNKDSGYQGSGLGLSIVAQILSMQNLDYGVKNMPDGVMFYFSIPGISISFSL